MGILHSSLLCSVLHRLWQSDRRASLHMPRRLSSLNRFHRRPTDTGRVDEELETRSAHLLYLRQESPVTLHHDPRLFQMLLHRLVLRLPLLNKEEGRVEGNDGMRHGNGVVRDVRSSDVEQPGDLVQGGDHIRTHSLLPQSLPQTRELLPDACACKLDRMFDDLARWHRVSPLLLPDRLHRAAVCRREHVRLQRLLQAPPGGDGNSRSVDADAL
mmetsp:Transcript_16574/g.37854  ORF Transcript_16574/g.37854 Transcript_16574/m.37854 type:complete len:214 (-) Transcript_16574:584-1225(-)